MKKILSILLCALLFVIGVIPVDAASVQEEREYLEDGSYFVETFSDSINEEKGESVFVRLLTFFRKLLNFFKGQKTVSKTKYLNYYSSENELLWSAKLSADFIYSKNNVSCTRADFSVDIFDADWKLLSSECDYAADTAKACFCMKQYKLLVPLKEIERTITMTCDKNGKIK